MPNWGDLVLKGEPYRMKILFVAGSNPAVTWPNSNKVSQALDKLDFLVVMDPFWTATAEKAHIVLPACTFIERISMCGIYEGHSVPAVQLRRPAVAPLWESWSDAKFWMALAKRMGGNFAQYIPWNSDEEAMDYWLSPSGLTVKYLTEEHPTGIVTGSPEPVLDYHKHGFPTPSGKCEFYSEELVSLGIDPLPIYREPPESPVSNPRLAKEYPLVLTTGIRELEYWHSQQRHCPRLRRRNPEARAELHPDTARECDIADGDYMTIETPRGKARMKAKVTENIRPGMVATAHGWLGEANENLLTDDMPADPEGGYPSFVAQLCKISKAA
jgi:anaerobic selenocysteine-containing dehydrogenase